MALDVTERLCLYVSIMGLACCYKMTVFYNYIWSFATEFILQMYTIQFHVNLTSRIS